MSPTIRVSPELVASAAEAIENDGNYWPTAKRAVGDVLDALGAGETVDWETLNEFGHAVHFGRTDKDLNIDERELCGRVADAIAAKVGVRPHDLGAYLANKPQEDVLSGGWSGD